MILVSQSRSGEALIDGPVTIGGACASDGDVTVMRGLTRFDCDLLLSPSDNRANTDGALKLVSLDPELPGSSDTRGCHTI